MNIRKSMIASLAASLVCIGVASAAPDVVVIANASAPIAEASAEDIARLYLGKTRVVSGQKLTPVDQVKGSPVAELFYRSVVGKTASQLRAYWSKLIFTGKGSPPKELDSDADVVAAVAADPELVGYVAASAVDGSVKVLMTVR